MLAFAATAVRIPFCLEILFSSPTNIIRCILSSQERRSSLSRVLNMTSGISMTLASTCSPKNLGRKPNGFRNSSTTSMLSFFQQPTITETIRMAWLTKRKPSTRPFRMRTRKRTISRMKGRSTALDQCREDIESAAGMNRSKCYLYFLLHP